jgi:hypothetical protein
MKVKIGHKIGPLLTTCQPTSPRHRQVLKTPEEQQQALKSATNMLLNLIGRGRVKVTVIYFFSKV